MFDRVEKLIGIDNLEKIKNTRVAVVGLGGVGGYVVEALVRSGILDVIVVDYDRIDISNLNRQIIANSFNVGKLKVDEMESRIKSINDDCRVLKIDLKLNLDNLDVLFSNGFDYLVDCCDTIAVKEKLISNCLERNIKIISCMGTGNKLDASLLKIDDIRNTCYDPIAKRIRKYVKDSGIKEKVPVVYSCEKNARFEGDIPSMMFVPSVAGIMCANYVIRDIISID